LASEDVVVPGAICDTDNDTPSGLCLECESLEK